MFDGIVGFFSHFQERDWATFSIALFAAAVSVLTLVRSYLNHHQTLLKDQADFTARWMTLEGRNVVWMVLENIGTSRAYSVRARFPLDPQHLLGLEETAQGPVLPEMQFALSTHLQADSFMMGTPMFFVDKNLTLEITWLDQFGVPRRKALKHEVLPHIRLSEGEQYPGIPEEKTYGAGHIGSAEYFDPRWPWQRRAWKRRARPDV